MFDTLTDKRILELIILSVVTNSKKEFITDKEIILGIKQVINNLIKDKLISSSRAKKIIRGYKFD